LIEAILTNDLADPDALDLGGDYLLPGLIEVHTDHLESHLLPRIGAAWPPYSAVIAHDAQLIAAGITTVLDAFTLGDLEDRHPRMETIIECIDALDSARAQGLLRVDHWLHLRCELAYPQLPAMTQLLASHARARLLSLMDHTPGQRQYRDTDQYRSYYAGRGLVWGDAQFAELIDIRRAQQKKFRETNLRAVLQMAQANQLHLASHDDASAGDVRDAHASGVQFAEFPTTIEAAQTARALGLLIIGGAPNLVRGGSHSGNVAAIELARQRCLDVLSSDFVPASLLHGAFVLAEQAQYSLPDAIATVTATPAFALGLQDRGRLLPGLRADLIRVRRFSTHPIVISSWVNGKPCF
jgi:alpha-D-ribose 1-methylphosphonate 5-triphosphate diphosphatase